MKKVMKKFKQSLSILLAVAMVVTMVPQNTLSVAAAEVETIEPTTEETGVETIPAETESAEASTETVQAETETTSVQEETETETVQTETESEEVIPEETVVEAQTEETNEIGEIAADGDSQVHSVTFAVDEAAVTVAGDSATTADADYTFTAKVNDGYENLVVAAYTTATYETEHKTEVEVTKPADGSDVYTIANDKITEDITIVVSATKIVTETNYKVAFAITGATVTDVTDAENTKEITGTVEVPEGKSLSFTVKANENYTLNKVTSTVADGEPTDLTADDEGVYTITPEADMSVTVEAKEIAEYTVNFAADENATITDVTVNGEAATVENGKVVVKADSTVTFKVSVAELYKVAEVNANDVVLTAEDGVYTMEAVTADTEVTVATQLDETKCNTLEFAVDGHKASYTATVSGNTVSGNDLSAGKTFSAGDTELIANGTIGVGLNIASGYELDKVEVVVDKKATVIEETDGYYNVSFTDNKNATLKVYTSPVGTEAAKTVVFANSASHMDYKVTTSETVKLEAGKKHTYTVAEGTKYINFTVTATGNYEPLVTLRNGTTPEFTKGATKNGKTPYTYSIAANMIAENESVTISETIENKNVKVTFAEDEVILTSASVGGKEVTEEENGNYKVPYGANITFTVAAQDNCKITKAVTTTGTKAKNEKVKANGFTFTVKATADSETVITSEALDTVVVRNNGITLEAVKGAYTVEYGKDYEILVKYGAAIDGEDVFENIQKIEVKSGKNAAASTVEKVDASSAKLVLAKEDAGKKLTVNVTIGEGENAKVVSATLNVLPIIQKVTIAGVKNGKVSQTADTIKEYKLTLNPKKAANTLAAEVTAAGEAPTEDAIAKAQAAVSALVEDGKLVIVTNTTEVTADVAVVKLYDTATSTTEAKSYVEGGTFAVSTTAPAWVNTKPSVALKSSDDTTLTLTLGAKNVETPVNGKVYYKVVVTPQTVEGTTTPEAITKATEAPFYVAKADAASQEAEVTVNNSGAGKGQAWKYDVKVTLVQTKDDTAITKENEESITAFKTAEGKEGTRNGLATKNPYYETKLKLKKGTTTVYTGQNDVLVATAQFGKNTTFTNITAKDKQGTSENGGLDVIVDGNRIFVSAKYISHDGGNEYTYPGRHTIEVTAEAPASMVAAKATITVDVKAGIEDIEVKAPSTLYKAEKKAASLTATAWTEPTFCKKVTWSIVDVDGNAFDENDALYGMVTVKNGKVTVNKNYIVSENESDNQFRVKAAAADFGTNTVYGLSDTVTITSEAVELGDVVIVQKDYIGLEVCYNVIARSGDTISADQITDSDAWAVVLKKNVAEKDRYTADEILEDGAVEFTSSNKAFSLNKDGYINAPSKTVKNVKITATATDGSKKKATLDKLTVGYTPVEELGLQVLDSNWNELALDKTDVKFYDGTGNTKFIVYVMEKCGEDCWGSLSGLTNYKLDVKGAKVVNKNAQTGWYEIVATGETATITLTDKSKKGDEAVKVCTLKNNALSTNKAPKLKASGNLIAGDYYGAQTITYSLPTGKNAYDYKDKYAMVTVDRVEAEKAANWYRYWEFEYYGDSLNGYMPVNENGTVDLWFGGEGYTCIPAGSYKLWFSFGTINEDGDFIADTKATAVTLKAVAPKTVKSSFKFTTSYKMSVKEGGSVELTGTGKNVNLHDLVCYNLKNANVNGTENQFLDYFTLEGNTLKLKSSLKPEELIYITGNSAKNDLTGYVDYELYGGYYSGTAKITVSFKDTVTKYAASNATVLEDTVTVADVTVTANKALANVGFAYVTDGDFGVTSVNGAVITLTYNGEGRPTVSGNAAGKKHKVTMYVVPANSYYTTELTALKAAADAEDATDEAKKAYTDAVQKYGVKVTSTITVKAKDVKGKISIAKKALTQKFTNGSYSHGEQNYTVIVPYTKNVPCQITNVKFSNDLFGFGGFSYIEDGTTFLRFTVNKPALAAAVEAGTVKYGETVKGVKATVKFADDAIDETFTFKFTLPNEAEMTYEKAVKAVEAAKADIEAAVVPDYWKGITEQEIIDSTYSTGIWGVCGEIVNLVPADSDTAIIMTQWNSEAGTYEVNANDFTAPTSQTAGKLTVKARLTSTAPVEEGQQAPSTDITFDLTIPATGMEPKDVEAKLNAFVSANLNGYATNLTTQEEVAADLREAAGLASNLRLMVTYFEMDKATRESSGELRVDFVITDIKYGAEPYEMNVCFNIDKLKTTGEAVTAVQAAVSGDALAELVKSNDAETVKTAVLEAANAAVNADGYTVAYATTDDVSGNNAKAEDVFSFVPATYKEDGKVSFTLVITDAEGNELENTVKVDETVAKNTSLQTLKDAKADILSALETFEAKNSTTADEVKAAAAKAVVNEAIALDYKTTKSDVSGNDVSGNDATEASFEIIEATVDADGKVKGTFVLTMGTETMEVAFEITIPKLA